MSNEMQDWLAENAREEKYTQDNRVLLEALRLAAFSCADEHDPEGKDKMFEWITQARKNLNLPN